MKNNGPILLLFIYNLLIYSHNGPDLIIFSKDRPLQLYALLESCKKNLQGTASISVIYRSSSVPFSQAYDIVHAEFPTVHFINENLTPTVKFKTLLCQTIINTCSDYVLFAVDDNLVIDFVDLCSCVEYMNKRSVYGFYLRLGSDITHCYSENRYTGIPPLQAVDEFVNEWNFEYGKGDWGYPHTVDMTIYRKHDILKAITTLPYATPNSFEGSWATVAPSKKSGLCFKKSKIVNIPINIVQTDFPMNRHEHLFDTQVLLELFTAGYKMKIDVLQLLPHSAPHTKCTVEFIQRLGQ